MRPFRTILIVAASILLCTVPAFGQCPAPCLMDFVAGTATCSGGSNISVWSAPADSNLDGWFEGCYRVNLDPASGCTVATIEGLYADASTGWTLSIGDSSTNNGFGGDGATQSNDAETNIRDNVLETHANDIGFTDRIHRIEFPRLRKITLEVRDQHLSWLHGGHAGSADTPDIQALYALAGQADAEGPVNYDIYVCGNRVVSGTPSRLGTGLSKMRVTVTP